MFIPSGFHQYWADHRLLDVEVDGAAPLLPVDVAPGWREGGGAAGGEQGRAHPAGDHQQLDNVGDCENNTKSKQIEPN